MLLLFLAPPPTKRKNVLRTFVVTTVAPETLLRHHHRTHAKRLRTSVIAENTQCDQMARLFFDIGPYITMEIRPKAYQFTEDGIKFCQILLDLLEIAQRF